HPLAQQPKGLVQLDILIDPVHRAGRRTAGPAEIVAADAAQAALDDVFLNHVPDGPEVVIAIIVTAGYEQLFRLDRGLGLALVVSEAQNMRRVRKDFLLLVLQPHTGPILRSRKGALGFAENA